MPFQLDVFCSKIFEICFSSMGCLYKQVHRWNTYSFLGLRPRPMAPALLVVQLLLPSHWEDWWRATILPGANGWEKDCTSWARLLWSCMFPAIRKILGIIRIYFEIYIYIYRMQFQHISRSIHWYYFSAFLVQPPRRCQEGGLRSGLRSRGSRVRPTSGGAAESRGWNGGAEGLVSPNLAHQDLQRSAGI